MINFDLTSWITQNRDICIFFIRRKFGLNEESAEDIFQTQCVTALTYKEKINHFQAWFYQGLILDGYNYCRVNKKYSFGHAFEGEAELTAEHILSNKQLTVRINRAVETLSPRQKVSVRAYYYEDTSGLRKHENYMSLKTHRRLALKNLKNYVDYEDKLCYDYSELTISRAKGESN